VRGRSLVAGATVLVFAAFTLVPVAAVIAGLREEAPGRSALGEVLVSPAFGRFALNSLCFAVAVTAGQVVTATLAGYALARLRFPGRERIAAALVALLAVPTVALVLPRYLLLQSLGWTDTLGGMISAGVVSLWGIILMRQAFSELPAGLEEAARLDGADRWVIFRELALPAVRPALAVLGLVAFTDAWKAYLWPLVLARPLGVQPLEVGVASLRGLYYSDWPSQMAAAGLAALPLAVVFLLARRHFIRGIERARLP
jgi:multiple sugar transport system permease protein